MSLFSTLGSIVGFIAGGPGGAALGSGLGTLLGGGTVKEAVSSGIGSLVTGGLGGRAGIIGDILGGGQTSMAAGNAVTNMFSGQGGGQGGQGFNPLASLMGGAGGQGQSPTAVQGQGGMPGQANQGGLGGLLKAFDNPLMMSILLKATEPKEVKLTSPEEQRRLDTGERNPDYAGTPAFDYRYNYARGGEIQGPGTGTSDSVRARIFQNGQPVREARLSDGEFVMTNRAVRGAGNGDRSKGAAEMYRMMHQFERRA